MHQFRSLIKAIALFLVVSVVSTLQAQDGLRDAFLRLDSVTGISSKIVGPAIAAADFNHDTHPDGAVLFRNNNTFQIEVHFRFQQVSRLTFASNIPALALSAFDVNHDGHPDLIVEEPFSRQRLFVWLNDGAGSFHPVNVDNYQAGPEGTSYIFAGPSGSPQSQAIAVPGKLRVRFTSSGSIRIPASDRLPRLSLQEAPHPTEFSSAPNLLRGPPTTVVL